MTLRLALSLAALLLAPLRLAAAPPTPAHWTVENLPKKTAAPGTAFTISLTARLDPGWHLYALEEPDGGPIATAIGLAETDPLDLLNVLEPKPIMVPDPTLHQPTGMFQNAVTFTLRLRAPHAVPPAGTVSHILVRYQSCNDQLCLPPHTETIPLPLAGLLR